MIGAISDEDAIMIVIDRNAIRIHELAWLVALLAEVGHERGAIAIVIVREYLHSMVLAVGGEQETSMMVERHAVRYGEQTISSTLSLGANREQLDSSCEVVTHLVISHSQYQ